MPTSRMIPLFRVWGWALAAATASIAVNTASAETLTLTHQGIERTTTLHRPATDAEKPRALLIALHGLGGTGEEGAERVGRLRRGTCLIGAEDVQ